MEMPIANDGWCADPFSKRRSVISGPLLATRGAVDQQDCPGVLRLIQGLVQQ
jgi:hypothetical protein